MNHEEMISAIVFCNYHKVELSFIDSLSEAGLIETTIIKETVFIPENQLRDLEKLMRFHYEMDINLEGLETINHLLQQIDNMQQEMVQLRNRLRLYETG